MPSTGDFEPRISKRPDHVISSSLGQIILSGLLVLNVLGEVRFWRWELDCILDPQRPQSEDSSSEPQVVLWRGFLRPSEASRA